MHDQKLIPDSTNMAKVVPMPKLGILRSLDNQKKGAIQGFDMGGGVEPVNPNSMFTESGRSGETSFTEAVPKNAISASDTVGGKPMTQPFDGKSKTTGDYGYTNKYNGNDLSVTQRLNSVPKQDIVAAGNAALKNAALKNSGNPVTPGVNMYSQDTQGNILKDGVAVPPKFPNAIHPGASIPSPTSVEPQAPSDSSGGNRAPSHITYEDAPDMSVAFTKKQPSIYTGMAQGGILKAREKHPIGKTDTVPAMLTPGEFVVKKDAVNKVGEKFLRDLNDGKVKGYEDGGDVDRPYQLSLIHI